MRTLHYRLNGNQATINVVENPDDFPAFVSWAKRHPAMAFDTETTGTEIYLPDFRLRLAQFGSETEAWVIPVELGENYAQLVYYTLRYAKQLYIHNASFDVQVAAQCLGIPIRELFRKVVDTSILSRLWDSRDSDDGGPGHSLEDLTRALISDKVADEVKASMRRLAAEIKVTKKEVFRRVPWNHPTYLLYAGMDPILTARLVEPLHKRIPVSARRLIRYEHELARVCAEISRTGFLLDRQYTVELIERLHQEETWWMLKIEKYTDDDEFQLGSTDEIARVLLDDGWDEFEFTPTGKLKVDDALLKRAAEAGHEFAEWVRQAKKCVKWRKTWPERFLALADPNDRVHPNIGTLNARTGRMSIAGFPAQTLPSDGALIRDCFVADPGHVIASVDFKAIEMRVIAALANATRMIEGIRAGHDPHDFTASLVFGPNYTQKQRKIMKGVGFGKVYGGGPATLAKQTGITLEQAKHACDAYDETYPQITEYTKRLIRLVARRGWVETPTGRRLYVDRDRKYSATNYMVQSTARDLFGRALLAVDQAGLTDYLRLPIHDELLWSLPSKEAPDLVEEIKRLMSTEFRGVPIAADGKVGGWRWGSLYQDE